MYRRVRTVPGRTRRRKHPLAAYGWDYLDNVEDWRVKKLIQAHCRQLTDDGNRKIREWADGRPVGPDSIPCVNSGDVCPICLAIAWKPPKEDESR